MAIAGGAGAKVNPSLLVRVAAGTEPLRRQVVIGAVLVLGEEISLRQWSFGWLFRRNRLAGGRRRFIGKGAVQHVPTRVCLSFSQLLVGGRVGNNLTRASSWRVALVSLLRVAVSRTSKNK